VAIRNLPTPTEAAKTAKRTAVRYLKARWEQIQYARFREAGYPIGSGIVESACKLVVEQRLKGSRVPRGVSRLGVTGHPSTSRRSWRCVVDSVVGSGTTPGSGSGRPGGYR